MKTSITLNLTLSKRLLFFLCMAVLCFVIVNVLNGVIIYMKGSSPAVLRISAVLQDVFAFIVPAILTAIMATRLPARFLCIEDKPKAGITLLACGVLLTALPLMNALVVWNESISLPDGLRGVENWMREQEASARAVTDVLIGGQSIAALLLSILIVAVLAGLSEELFFRGTFQRLLTTGGINPHLAIWLVAFVFSAMHLQFYGFFGRMLLGAYFGYLLYWTRVLWIPILAHIFNNTLYIIGNYQLNNAENPIDPEATGGVGLVLVSCALTLFLLVTIYRLARAKQGERGLKSFV